MHVKWWQNDASIISNGCQNAVKMMWKCCQNARENIDYYMILSMFFMKMETCIRYFHHCQGAQNSIKWWQNVWFLHVFCTHFESILRAFWMHFGDILCVFWHDFSYILHAKCVRIMRKIMENEVQEGIKNDANVVYMSLVSEEGVAKDRKIMIFGSTLAWFWSHFGIILEDFGSKMVSK